MATVLNGLGKPLNRACEGRASGWRDRQRVASGARYDLRERAFGRLERVVPLPARIGAAGLQAGYRGVLTVELPKTGASSTPRIGIQ
jgi:HSP20 family protein